MKIAFVKVDLTFEKLLLLTEKDKTTSVGAIKLLFPGCIW